MTLSTYKTAHGLTLTPCYMTLLSAMGSLFGAGQCSQAYRYPVTDSVAINIKNLSFDDRINPQNTPFTTPQ